MLVFFRSHSFLKRKCHYSRPFVEGDEFYACLPSTITQNHTALSAFTGHMACPAHPLLLIAHYRRNALWLHSPAHVHSTSIPSLPDSPLRFSSYPHPRNSPSAQPGLAQRFLIGSCL